MTSHDNPILAMWRNEHKDPYALIYDLKSRWSMQFADAEVDFAYEVIDRWIEVFG
jgi:hypothetical protein